MKASKSNSLPLAEEWVRVTELIQLKINIIHGGDNKCEEYSAIVDTIENTLHNIEKSLKNLESASPELNSIMMSMSQLLELNDLDINFRIRIVKALVYLSEKNFYRLDSRNFVNVICFLMENCCAKFADKQMVPLMKILKKLSNSVGREESTKLACLLEKNRLSESLTGVMKNEAFCVSDIGVDVIGLYLSMDEEFIRMFHNYVTHILISCKKKSALKYGKIYFRIWDNLCENDKPEFEKNYIQWYMDRGCTLNRVKRAQRILLENVQSLLKGLHLSRKMAKFSRVVTNLYTPILWKYLNSDNNIHRCNAAEIFMDVYPLERPGEGMKSYSKYMRKQHDEMLALLDDTCPLVRVIAIKGVCANMRYFWITFQNNTSESIIKKFVVELVSDGSSSDVRRAVYQGLSQLLECSDAHKLLKCVLPSLGSYIHDENQSVRQAFMLLLMKLKKLDCKIKFYHIVDIENLAARLAADTPKNRELIVHLILPNFFSDKFSTEESFSRVCKFVKVNPVASRYLAMYSADILKFETAVHFMNYVLDQLKYRVTLAIKSSESENLADLDEIEKSFACETIPDKNILSNIENLERKNSVNASHNQSRASVNDSGLNRSISFDEPRIAHGLLDFVGMLWLIHGKTLQKEENRERLEELYCHAQKSIINILRFYKGTKTFFGALNLAGMIPLTRIIHETLIVGICRSMLQNVTPNTPSNEIHCIIHALCLWNRGGEIIELAKEWLDEAFRTVDLNESMAVTRFRSRKQVKFIKDDAKPSDGLRILDELFSSPSDQKLIFSKNLDELKDLLVFLSRIKILTERRIDNGSHINIMLDDEFIIHCLELFGNLIIMFNENHVDNFNFWKQFFEYLMWCDSLLVKCNGNIYELAHECDSFISKVILVPLRQCVNIIALGKCKDNQLLTVLKFVQSVLDSESGIFAIEISLSFIKQLGLFSQTHQNDVATQSEIFDVWYPSIVNKIFELLTEKSYSKDTITKFIKNISSLKKNLLYILLMTLKLHPKLTRSSVSYRILSCFCHSLINIILFPIIECETLNVDQNVKNLPFTGSIMASIFISQVELSSALIFVFKCIVENLAEEDGLTLLACCSLLYTFAFSHGKMRKSELMKAVCATYLKVQKIPIESGLLAVAVDANHTLCDRTMIDIEETAELARKEAGIHILRKVAEKLEGSLPAPSDILLS